MSTDHPFPTAELHAYVSEALRLHDARLRSNGLRPLGPVPHLMAALDFRVTQGQSGSPLDAPAGAVEVGVTKPLAVKYETAAEMLGVSVSTIKREIKAGRLTPIAFGGARVLRVVDLEARLDQSIDAPGEVAS